MLSKHIALWVALVHALLGAALICWHAAMSANWMLWFAAAWLLSSAAFYVALRWARSARNPVIAAPPAGGLAPGADRRMQLVATAFEQGRQGIIIADALGRIVLVNPTFSTITGYAEAEALGRSPRMLSSGNHDADFYAAMWDSIERTGAWQGELWNRRKDGGLYAELLTISRVAGDDGKVRNYVGIFADITEHKQGDEQIQRLARHDALTGLPNRLLLTERAGQAISLARRDHAAVAVLFLDLDHFKTVNDALGHRVGDLVLIEVAKRLLAAVREYDTVSRQGGDEFVVILPSTGAEGAAHVAEKIRQLLAVPLSIDQHQINMTTSIGIALFPGDGNDFEELAIAADTAMYRAKQTGRDRYCLFAP